MSATDPNLVAVPGIVAPFYAAAGVVGLATVDLVAYRGYDARLRLVDGAADGVQRDLDRHEQVALADFMVGRWHDYRQAAGSVFSRTCACINCCAPVPVVAYSFGPSRPTGREDLPRIDVGPFCERCYDLVMAHAAPSRSGQKNMGTR